MAGPNLPLALPLQVAERRQIVAGDPVRDQVVIGAPTRHEPGSGGPTGQRAFQHDVGVGERERGRSSEPVGGTAGAVVDDQNRRQTIAVLDAKSAGRQLETFHGLRIEGRGQPEEPVGVVDLHAVHHGEILIGPAAPYRISGCRNRPWT